MPTFDDKGRIKRVDQRDKIYSGHSVCNTCDKDMAVCWDTVCYFCGNTSCYEHSGVIDNKWMCAACYKTV